MSRYDHDLAMEVESHADPEGERAADEAYAKASEEAMCKQKLAGCTGKAETTYLGDWPVCYRCLDKLSE
jgi:hypothetical protein